MTSPETLIERARLVARCMETRTPMPSCPYPAGECSDAYTAGAAMILLSSMADALHEATRPRLLDAPGVQA